MRKSREHRAFAGFSMGSFTTIQAAMMRNLEVLCIDILEEMSECFTDGENFAWIDYEGGYQTYNSWITDLHNCLTVFFQ